MKLNLKFLMADCASFVRGGVGGVLSFLVDILFVAQGALFLLRWMPILCVRYVGRLFIHLSGFMSLELCQKFTNLTYCLVAVFVQSCSSSGDQIILKPRMVHWILSVAFFKQRQTKEIFVLANGNVVQCGYVFRLYQLDT